MCALVTGVQKCALPIYRLWLPVEKHRGLNERHYGGLTGLNKAEMIAKAGEEQVRIWRRSFDVPPPPVEPGSQYDPSNDRRYQRIDVPRTESLKDTIARVLPYWDEKLAPALKGGERVLISAHGNSRSEERRVGKECVRPCRSRWSP